MTNTTIAGKELLSLGTRPAFNRTLRHVVNVSNMIDIVDKGGNLADVLHDMVESGHLQRDQLAPILGVILVSRLNLPYRSKNIDETVNSFDAIQIAFKRWTALDLIIAYQHPNLGLIPINPVKQEHWDVAHELKHDELIVVYCRHKGGKNELAQKGLDAFFKLLNSEIPEEDPGFVAPVQAAPVAQPVVQQQPVSQQQAVAPPSATVAPAPSAPSAAKPSGGGKRNLTPKYSVQVTNELFHNGNVEAWKNIIESYQAKIPGARVIVYYENELIQDLNSLFKWGKVKHGGIIMFQVAGDNVKFVSRLQKYLFEGASSRFEAFMKRDVTKVLTLF